MKVPITQTDSNIIINHAHVKPANGHAHAKSGHPLSQGRSKKPSLVAELKISRLRECPVENPLIDAPPHVEKFWRANIETSPHYNPEVESLWVLLLNTRYKLIGFQQISMGTRDTILVDPGLVFRLAVVKNAAAIILAHNHPSGAPSPSDNDIMITHRLISGGKLLNVELKDHIIIGSPHLEKPYASLRELGVFGDIAGAIVSDKEKASTAFYEALSTLESFSYETKGFFRLISNNFEYLTHTGDIDHSDHDKEFSTGITFMVNRFVERFGAIVDKVRAASRPFSKIV